MCRVQSHCNRCCRAQRRDWNATNQQRAYHSGRNEGARLRGVWVNKAVLVQLSWWPFGNRFTKGESPIVDTNKYVPFGLTRLCRAESRNIPPWPMPDLRTFTAALVSSQHVCADCDRWEWANRASAHGSFTITWHVQYIASLYYSCALKLCLPYQPTPRKLVRLQWDKEHACSRNLISTNVPWDEFRRDQTDNSSAQAMAARPFPYLGFWNW